MAEVHHERRGDVAILTMDRPVANALGPSLRASLLTELEAAIAADEVRAIVLQGGGLGFSSGVDIPEYDGPQKTPLVSTLCQRIDQSPKPVVAALHGSALGGGFELALAAHARVAARGTRVALPEVTLGLIPSGGATQRLPRMVGAPAALELMLSGQSVDIADPRLTPIIDKIVPDAPLEEAIALARLLVTTGDWQSGQDRVAGLSDPQKFQKAVTMVRSRLPAGASAEADILNCTEAALLLPLEQGLALEQIMFEERRAAPDARARRHFFTAERRALIMREMAQGQAAPVADIAVLGGGDLVAEIGIACLDGGARVSLVCAELREAKTIYQNIAAHYRHVETQGGLTAAARDELLARLLPSDGAEALARADLVLDTGQLPMDDSLAGHRPEAVWVILTGDAAAPFEPAQEAAFDGRCIGMRMFRPVQDTKLVELVVPNGADASAVATVAQLFIQMGRTVIRCTPDPGLVGDNMSAALYEAALILAGTGVDPFAIDAAARVSGFAEGPFQLMDREGLAYVAERLERRANRRGVAPLPGDGVLALRLQSGATGRAEGHGFHIYDTTGTRPDLALQTGHGNSTDLGGALWAALVNEAADLLAAGTVARASDIDLVMVKGYGFNARLGGPLLQADLRGMLGLVQHMKRLSDLSAPLWKPRPMITEMVKNGVGFFGRAG